MPLDIIQIDNLTFHYNGTAALSNISLQVKQGDYLAVAGPNGSGKSTLIKNILGILQPQEGAISIFGKPTALFKEWQRIGYLPQRINALNTHFPCQVAEMVKLGLTREKRKGFDDQRSRRILEMMKIDHLSSQMIGELSYGEQQRVMLARAIVNQPDLLILDEPTTALDPETRDIFYEITRELNDTHGATIIIITHDTGTIGQHARQLLYLDKKIIFSGSFSDFCSSADMSGFFGTGSQHIICHQHDRTVNN